MFSFVFPFFCIFPLEAQENGSTPTPHLELDSTYLDLGLLEKDSITNGVLGFRNSGDAPLVISNIFSECGCTAGSYPKEPVAPGERGEIGIRFNAKGRREGPVRKALRIRSNADNSRVVVIVKAHL